MKKEIITERLVLRSWQEQDYQPFAELNSDPQVLKFFPKLLSAEESNHLISRFQKHIDEKGWGLWAAALRETNETIGLIGLQTVYFDAPFVKGATVEIGWRLAKKYWGKGYATEGALAALDFGFNELGLKEIVSFTYYKNLPSRKVMERIGMSRKEEDDFDHPLLPEGHPLRKHVLYRSSG